MDRLGGKLFTIAAAVMAATAGAIVMLNFCLKIIKTYLYFI